MIMLLLIVMIAMTITDWNATRREEVMTDLMKETEDVASRRRAYKEMRDLLHKATDIVNEVRTSYRFMVMRVGGCACVCMHVCMLMVGVDGKAKILAFVILAPCTLNRIVRFFNAFEMSLTLFYAYGTGA